MVRSTVLYSELNGRFNLHKNCCSLLIETWYCFTAARLLRGVEIFLSGIIRKNRSIWITQDKCRDQILKQLKHRFWKQSNVFIPFSFIMSHKTCVYFVYLIVKWSQLMWHPVLSPDSKYLPMSTNCLETRRNHIQCNRYMDSLCKFRTMNLYLKIKGLKKSLTLQGTWGLYLNYFIRTLKTLWVTVGTYTWA